MRKTERIWQRMLSGRRLNLAEPSPLDIEIADIARGLSRTNRWSGQTQGVHGLSVAQHSVLVMRQLALASSGASPRQRSLLRAALLHDAAEYVIGDMISPFKKFVGGDYLLIEQRLQEAIHQRFALPLQLAESWRRAIKRADRAIAWLEATQLAGFSSVEAGKFIARRPCTLVQEALEAYAPDQAEAEFLAALAELTDP